MDIARSYGDMVRRKLATDPHKAGILLRRGLFLESLHQKLVPPKGIPHALSSLNSIALEHVASSLKHPETYVWTNLFAPVELLQVFGLRAISMECLASLISGFYLEDCFIDRSDSLGLASTLCSYHRNFLGAVDSGILPKPVMGLTSSTICDGNINTFRYVERVHKVPCSYIDVPVLWSPEAQGYVRSQLEELILTLEEKSGKEFDEEKLKDILRRENESKTYYRSFLQKRAVKAYPSTLTLELFLLFASHLEIGSEWVLDFYREMDEEIDSYPESDEKRIFWVHLVPYAEETLRRYLNQGKEYAVIADDLNLDYMEELDVAHPLDALSRKLIMNLFNGDFSRKAGLISGYVREFGASAVVEFCHWGCKQSCGGVQLLKERMREEDVPMLVLDGDALDRRNTFPGQIRTRFEAFLELLEER